MSQAATLDRRLRVLIVDDEPLAVERLQILCGRIEGLELAGTAADGAAALRLIDGLHPDVVLLDIAMPDMDGIGVAQAASALNRKAAIIFVTAYDSFALCAFDIAAVDYLLKPVEQHRLERAVDRARRLLTAAGEPTPPLAQACEFWVTYRSQLIRILAADIDLIEAERDYMRLHVGSRSFLLHRTIGQLQRQLDPASFLRLHRSTIVARNRIAALQHRGYGSWDAVLQDGRALRIGRSYLPAVRAMVTG